MTPLPVISGFVANSVDFNWPDLLDSYKEEPKNGHPDEEPENNGEGDKVAFDEEPYNDNDEVMLGYEAALNSDGDPNFVVTSDSFGGFLGPDSP